MSSSNTCGRGLTADSEVEVNSLTSPDSVRSMIAEDARQSVAQLAGDEGMRFQTIANELRECGR